MSHHNLSRRFDGLNRLYPQTENNNATEKLATYHTIIIGIGGVGSWAAEALARSGIGSITLIDLDNIAESNINRQIHALSSTIGMPKVVEMQNRILQIHPECTVKIIEDFLSPENIEEYLAPMFQNTKNNWILDCTDSVKTKAALIAWARQNHYKIITAGAAGGKTDPSKLKIADLSTTHYDALCQRLKQTLRKYHRFPQSPKKFNIPCVYIEEHTVNPSTKGGLNCAGYGSIVTMTASMGMFMASYVINHILKK